VRLTDWETVVGVGYRCVDLIRPELKRSVAFWAPAHAVDHFYTLVVGGIPNHVDSFVVLLVIYPVVVASPTTRQNSEEDPLFPSSSIAVAIMAVRGGRSSL